MQNNDTRSNKTAGIDSKPATIILSAGGTLDVAHHIVPTDKDVVHAFVSRDGIDATLPLEEVAAIVRDDADDDAVQQVIAALNASQTASDAVSERGDDGAELVADGGRPRDALADDASLAGLAADARERRARENADPSPCANPSCDEDVLLDDTCNSHCWGVMDAARRINDGEDVDVFSEYEEEVQRAVDALNDDADAGLGGDC